MRKLPEDFAVYQFATRAKKIGYIGETSNLKRRTRDHLYNTRRGRVGTRDRAMWNWVPTYFRYQLCDTKLQAKTIQDFLIAEYSKKFGRKPRHNQKKS